MDRGVGDYRGKLGEAAFVDYRACGAGIHV